MNKKQLMEKNEAILYLRSLFLDELKKGIKPTVYTTVKHVSSSGMMRHIDVIYIKDNHPINLNWHIEKLGTYKRASSYNVKNADSLRVGGCGMDMGFSVVYGMSRQIFQDFDFAQFKIKGRNGEQFETDDAGYLLNQRWL